MYIGPQGIVHGTTITVLNDWKIGTKPLGKIFLTSGLGVWWYNQKVIFLDVLQCVLVNIKAIQTRFEQNWVDEIIDNVDKLCKGLKKHKRK